MGVNVHRRAGSIFWLVIGVYSASHAYQLGLGRLRHPGPGFVFFLAAFLLIILGAIDLARTFLGKPKTEKEKEGQHIWRDIRWQKVLLVLGGVSVYTYFLNLAGFWVSTFLLMLFLYKVVEPTRWRIAIVCSLITIMLSYGIFKVWLDVQFPTGILGF
jgi:putative tricarboxylic transport membrane protein